MNRTLTCLVLTALSALLTTRTLAADTTVAVEVTAPFEPISAVGLILTETGTTQKIDTTVTPGRGGAFVVSFPLNEGDIPAGALATALLIAEDGAMSFGPVKPIGTAEQRTALSDIPDCPPDKIVTAGLEGQLGLLESLFEVRAARRANSQKRLAELLTPELTAKFAKLEEGFGLAHTTPLRPDLPPLEIHSRATRVMAALRDFRAAKRRAEEQERAAAAAPASAEESADQSIPR